MIALLAYCRYWHSHQYEVRIRRAGKTSCTEGCRTLLHVCVGIAAPGVLLLGLQLANCTMLLHTLQVLSGLLVAPGVPEWAERREMETLADTYGKTVRRHCLQSQHPSRFIK
jgi:hypothetical protein